MVFDDYYDFPYENIGFDTPYDEGGVLMCFIIKEQNRNCHMKLRRVIIYGSFKCVSVS